MADEPRLPAFVETAFRDVTEGILQIVRYYLLLSAKKPS